MGRRTDVVSGQSGLASQRVRLRSLPAPGAPEGGESDGSPGKPRARVAQPSGPRRHGVSGGRAPAPSFLGRSRAVVVADRPLPRVLPSVSERRSFSCGPYAAPLSRDFGARSRIYPAGSAGVGCHPAGAPRVDGPSTSNERGRNRRAVEGSGCAHR